MGIAIAFLLVIGGVVAALYYGVVYLWRFARRQRR
jgi:hypothetical protein